MKRKVVYAVGTALAVLVALSSFAVVNVVRAANGNGNGNGGLVQTVGGDNQKGWKIDVTSPDGAVQFVSGPSSCAGSQQGTGSVRLFTGTHGDESAQLRGLKLGGTPLANLTTLTYATCDTANNGGQWPYIMLNIDLNGDGTADDFLFFEPVYQTPTANGNSACLDQGAPVLDTWQTWDAKNGCWWSVDGIAGAGPGTAAKTLSQYLAAAPNAIIVNSADKGGLRLAHGFASPSDVYDGYVDFITVGTTSFRTTFNFEAA